MATRKLTEDEKASITSHLDEAKKQLHLLNSYVSRLEKELQEGVTWCYDPTEFMRFWKRTEEKVL